MPETKRKLFNKLNSFNEILIVWEFLDSSTFNSQKLYNAQLDLQDGAEKIE